MRFLVAFSTFATMALQVVVAQSLTFTHTSSVAIFVLPWSFAGLALGCLFSLWVAEHRLSGLFLASAALFATTAWIYLYMDFNQSPAPLAILLFSSVGVCFGLAFRCALRSVKANAVYIWDLVGALCGALFVFALPVLRLEGSFLFLVLAFALVGLWYGRHGTLTLRLFALALAVVAAVLFLAQIMDSRFQLSRSAKGDIKPHSKSGLSWDRNGNFCLRSGDCELIDSAWDITSTVEAMRYTPNNHVYLYYDNVRYSQVVPIDSGPFPFNYVSKIDKSLVIGVGAGRELHILGRLGAKDITGVEINSATIRLMTGPLVELSQGIYQRSLIVNEDGRTFLSRSKDRYDLISLHWVDSETRSGFGNVFLENYLYSKEGLTAAIDHLSEEGTFVIVKGFPTEQRPELTRVVLTLREILDSRGLNPAQHIMIVRVVRNRPNLLIQVSKRPHTQQFFADVKASVDRQVNAQLVYPEYSEIEATDSHVVDVLRSAVEGPPMTLVEPPTSTDNWPFVYAEPELGIQFKHLWPLCLAWVLGLLGLVTWGWSTQAVVPSGAVQTAVVTGVLGVCFGLLETVLFQTFNVFVGLPMLTLVATICSLLAGGMVASVLSGRLSTYHVVALTAGTSVYVTLLVKVIKPQLFAMNLDGLWPRALVLFVVLLPAGFLPAFMFPRALIGLRRYAETWPIAGLVTNLLGCSIGTWMGMQLALAHGFAFVRAIVVLLYMFLALGMSLRLRSRQRGMAAPVVKPTLA